MGPVIYTDCQVDTAPASYIELSQPVEHKSMVKHNGAKILGNVLCYGVARVSQNAFQT